MKFRSWHELLVVVFDNELAVVSRNRLGGRTWL